MTNYNIPINKGNYSMETPEREELFEKYRGEGWEEEYKNYRKNWSELPKNFQVEDYPLLVDLELSTVCNLKCPMCYTITDEFKSKINSEFMEFELFKKLIDEIKEKVPAIRLSLRGEPTLHPKFSECIKYAKEKGIKEISFLTNASKLTPEYFEKIMFSGVDWITISVDGLNETYENIRRPLKFNETLEKIKKIKAIKEKHNSNKPVIKVQSIWLAIKDNYEEFYETFAPYVDLIAFNPLIDYLENDENIDYIENFSCPQLYQRMVVCADGSVNACSNDENSFYTVGNANESSIYEIWHNEKYQKIRELHKQENGFKNFEMCKKCYIPRLTEDSNPYKLKDREFVVKNYVNRVQIIGK
ncbi:MAG TPA: radical SAM protein [Candidatus Gastranaerophilales bacterium]|nr:radical SAM protein [Candidatus Gastranaerophilales bacterium]